MTQMQNAATSNLRLTEIDAVRRIKAQEILKQLSPADLAAVAAELYG